LKIPSTFNACRATLVAQWKKLNKDSGFDFKRKIISLISTDYSTNASNPAHNNKNQNEDYKFHHNLISSTYGLHFIKVVLCILLELPLLDFTITLYVYVSLGSCCVVLKTLEEKLFFSIGGKKSAGSD
jgi:hypothetical protein